MMVERMEANNHNNIITAPVKKRFGGKLVSVLTIKTKCKINIRAQDKENAKGISLVVAETCVLRILEMQ